MKIVPESGFSLTHVFLRKDRIVKTQVRENPILAYFTQNDLMFSLLLAQLFNLHNQDFPSIKNGSIINDSLLQKSNYKHCC